MYPTRVSVVDPSVIRDQMLLTDFTFLKFFLSAVAAGMYCSIVHVFIMRMCSFFYLFS